MWLDAGIALLLSAATGLLYWWAAGPVAGHQSTAPHFVLLADALLHGHLWIDPVRAARLGDVTPYGGRVYVAFPPLPAVLLLPAVAVAGPGANDAMCTLLLGAANVGLAYLMVRRLSRPGFAGSGLPLGRGEASLVAAVLGAGTVHCYAALMGRVWFTAHIVAVTGLLLYVWECAGRGRPLVAGAALAAAFLARTPAALGAVFWVVLAQRAGAGHGALLPRLARFALPGALAAGLLLAQNAARFGSPVDFGYLSMRVSPVLAPDLRRYGQFNVHFVPRNVAAFLLTPPVLQRTALAAWWRRAGGVRGALRRLAVAPPRGQPAFPIQFDPWGTGLWAVSPVLGFTLRRPRRGDRRLYVAAWASALAVAVPNLLYYNTGWVQFGYRFSLDFTPFLLVPLAGGLRRPLHPAWWVIVGALFAVSAASNVLGARWFLRLPPY